MLIWASRDGIPTLLSLCERSSPSLDGVFSVRKREKVHVASPLSAPLLSPVGPREASQAVGPRNEAPDVGLPSLKPL